MFEHKAAKAMMVLAIVSQNLAEQYPPGPKRNELDQAAKDARELAEEIEQFAAAQRSSVRPPDDPAPAAEVKNDPPAPKPQDQPN